jgi:hypothetical protein
VRKLLPARIALLATALVAFAGNLIYYMSIEPYMAHSTSVFASSLFFYTWWQRRNQRDIWTPMLLGAIAGLMAMIRPQDGAFLALPFLVRLSQEWRSDAKAQTISNHMLWLRDCMIAGFVALLVFTPQLVIWQKLYGEFFRSPYLHSTGAKFNWVEPQLLKVLFSEYHGLFAWHPVFLFAIVGLIMALRRYPTLAWASILGFILQWYIISSWHAWSQGDAFGGRMFIVCVPIFAVGLGYLLQWLAERRLEGVAYTVGMLLLVLNLLLLVHYRLGGLYLLHPPTWHDLLWGRFLFWFQ